MPVISWISRHSNTISEIINSEDRHVAEDVGCCIHDIAAAIDQIADRVREGGRLIYIGAGTSGRYFSFFP